jgi:hypothetical protein
MILRRSYTIGGIMWAIFFIAFALAGSRYPVATWARVMLLVTFGVLALACIGAVWRPASERPWWLGFLLFGGGYLWLALWHLPELTHPLPTECVVFVFAGPFHVPTRFWRPGLAPPMTGTSFLDRLGIASGACCSALWGVSWACASPGSGSVKARHPTSLPDPPTSYA